MTGIGKTDSQQQKPMNGNNSTAIIGGKHACRPRHRHDGTLIIVIYNI